MSQKPVSGQSGTVKIASVFDAKRILIIEQATKPEVLDALVDCLADTPQVKDRDDLKKGIFKREELMSTGIGFGVAIPHVRLDSVDDIVAAAAVCRQPIEDYASLDNQPVRLVFMIAAGQSQHDTYLRLLAMLAEQLKKEQFRSKLISAADPESFYRILAGKEN